MPRLLAKTHVLARLLAFAGLAAAAALASAADNRIDRIRPDAPVLAAYGKLPIGVRTLNWVNPGQVDVLKAKAGEPLPLYDRPLTVEVWYPAKPVNAAAGVPQALTWLPRYRLEPRWSATDCM